MPEPLTSARLTCPKCGATMAVITRESRNLIDIVGATVLGLLVLGLALLFGSIFGSGGGRAAAMFIGIAAFIIWVLWHMVGSTQEASRQCPSCGPSSE